MNNTSQNRNRQFSSVLLAVIYGVTYLAATWLLKHYSFSTPVSVMIAVIPIVAFAFFIWKYIKAFLVMDEVKQRVQLEAVVIGFSLTAMLLMLLFLLSLCGISNTDWFGYSHLLAYCWIFYFIGWLSSKRKYGV